MSDKEVPLPDEKEGRDDEAPGGPSLTLLYSLVALALAVAIGIALMIVYPFYKSR